MNLSVIVAGALPRNLHYEYNAAGKVTNVTLPVNQRTACPFNQARPMEMITLPDDSGLLKLHDTEGHTAQITCSLASAEKISADLPVSN